MASEYIADKKTIGNSKIIHNQTICPVCKKEYWIPQKIVAKGSWTCVHCGNTIVFNDGPIDPDIDRFCVIPHYSKPNQSTLEVY